VSPIRSLCWAAGVLRPLTEFRPHLDERAFRYGDGVFATLSLRRGRLLDAEAHLDRLRSSAAAIDLGVPEPVRDVGRLSDILLLLGADGGRTTDGVIRVQVSAGPGGRGFGRGEPGSWELVEIHSSPDSRRLTVVVLDPGEVPVPALPRVKSCSSLAHVLCSAAATRRGCAEAVRTSAGHPLEAAASNLFWEADGELFTPSATLPLYPGVTREVALRVARSCGWTVHEGEFDASALARARAAFLTNAVRGMEPVAELEGRRLAWTPELESLRTAVESERDELGVPLDGSGAAAGRD